MRIANLKAVCGPDILKLDKQSTASERLVEAWQIYESSHQDILSMVAECEVDDNARKIIKGKHRSDDVAKTLRP